MFTLEIGGKPIAITDTDEAQAQSIFGSEEFRQDLMVMTSEGMPLWDGQTSFTIRPANEQEITLFEAPEFDVDEDDGDDVFVTFLVPIDHDHEESVAIPPELRN